MLFAAVKHHLNLKSSQIMQAIVGSIDQSVIDIRRKIVRFKSGQVQTNQRQPSGENGSTDGSATADGLSGCLSGNPARSTPASQEPARMSFGSDGSGATR